MKNLLKIILAEDDCDDSFLFREAVNALPYTVSLEVVEDGEQLINRLADKFIPDFIFLDLNMPKRDGFGCLKYINNHKQGTEMMIIILSTSSNIESVNFAYDHGADLYLKKPDNFNSLVHGIEFCLQHRKKKYPEKPARDKFLLLV